MAAASSGDVMEREAGSELLEVDSLQSEKSGLESEKSGTPQEGTEDHMNVVEVSVWAMGGRLAGTLSCNSLSSVI